MQLVIWKKLFKRKSVTRMAEKHGFPPVVIKVGNRLEYYEALDKAHTTEDDKVFISLIEQPVNDPLDLYIIRFS